MPELMFRYRAAAWFSNTNCPEVTLGLPMVDELRDIVEMEPSGNGKYQPTGEVKPIVFENESKRRGRRRKEEIEEGKEITEGLALPAVSDEIDRQPGDEND